MDKRLSPVAFTAPAVFKGTAPEADGTRAFSGVAYGGGVVTDHPWIDRVAFDLASTKVVTPAPVLYRHNDPIGVMDSSAIDQNIEIGGKLFANIEGEAKNVALMADHGMPWQLSVGIWPGRIEEVKAGAKISLNGRDFDGPLTIFRDSRVREVSFCALGADDQTHANLFAAVSEGGSRPATFNTTGVREMDQAEHDRIVSELQVQLTAEKAKTTELADKVATFESAATTAARETRIASVKDLFKATGREFTDTAAAHYIAMDAATFAAVSADLKAKPAHDPKLFQSQATDGAPAAEEEARTTESIVAKAQLFIVEQAKLGKTIAVSDAVRHVKSQGAAA